MSGGNQNTGPTASLPAVRSVVNNKAQQGQAGETSEMKSMVLGNNENNNNNSSSNNLRVQRPESIRYASREAGAKSLPVSSPASTVTTIAMTPPDGDISHGGAGNTKKLSVTYSGDVADDNNNNNNDDGDGDPTTDEDDEKIMYGDFLVLTFVGFLLFLFCVIGAVGIYFIEQPGATTVFHQFGGSNNNQRQSNNTSTSAVVVNNNPNNNNNNGKTVLASTTISISDYFESGNYDEAKFSRLLKAILSDVAEITEDRWQLISLNNSHVKIVVSPKPPEYEFDLYGSFFFSFDVITTIGFGQRYPVTDTGKFFTTVLTLLGCPLIVLFCTILADKMKLSGFRIGRGICRISSSRRSIINGSDENIAAAIPAAALTKQQQQQLPHMTPKAQACRRSCATICLEMTGIVIFILVPSMAFCIQEPGWTYLDSIYFSVNALSTTGFGDYLAGENKSSPVLGFYRFIYIVWLLIGMTWWNAYNEAAAVRLRRMVDAILKPLAICLHKREQAAMAGHIAHQPSSSQSPTSGVVGTSISGQTSQQGRMSRVRSNTTNNDIRQSSQPLLTTTAAAGQRHRPDSSMSGLSDESTIVRAPPPSRRQGSSGTNNTSSTLVASTAAGNNNDRAATDAASNNNKNQSAASSNGSSNNNKSNNNKSSSPNNDSKPTFTVG